MKCKILCGLAGLLLVTRASSQTATYYINDAIVTTPPQVDALNFINNGTFSIFLGALVLPLPPYQTANTLNYTNRGLLDCDTGFRFDTFSTSSGLHRPAASFYNQASGSINCGILSSNFGIILTPLVTSSRLFVEATNIVNRGVINVAQDSLASFKGKNVDLSRGLLAGQNSGGSGSLSIYPGYWGLDTVEEVPAASFGFFATTPFHWITNRYYQSFQTSLGSFGFANGAVYSIDQFTGPSNRVVSAVFLFNTNSAFSNNVYFSGPGGAVIVEWLWPTTNFLTDTVVTNQMLLQDTFGSRTNFQLARSGTAAPNTGSSPAFIPTNYSFFSSSTPLFLGAPAPLGPPAGGFTAQNVTNEYTAYEAIFTTGSALLGEIAGQTYSNIPGRIEIDATEYLNLNRARLGAVNYLSLKSTNHFGGSERARISSPMSSMDLHTTNGLLVMTNLMLPVVPRLEGPVDLWSARWTNVDNFNITNRFHVLFVNSALSTTATPRFLDLKLRSTNVVIHDVLNVLSNFHTLAENLTVASNAPGADNFAGELNLLNGDILWPTATPRLRNLTNDGVISTFNAAFFGGSRTTPFFSTNFNEPYESFVNRGSVSTAGSLIWARHFENHGAFLCGPGSFSLEQNLSALLTDGVILASGGDVTLNSGSLTLSNVVINAGRSLTLSATNFLTDTGITNGNIWSVGDGFGLLARPATGDLFGTTIFSTASPFVEVINRWAGADRGCSVVGFTNNAALGRLILDGGTDSQQTFTGTGAPSAIYVDYLELRNYMTNRDPVGNLVGVQIEPNMKVYFAQAVVNGVSVAAKLDGQGGGRFCWVSDYAGYFSSTNIIYPDGSTNSVNAALAANSDLDSDCDNLANSLDNTPLFLITTSALADATNNAAYAVQVNAFGGPNSPVTWSLAPGSDALPSGLSLSPAGVIAGTPLQTGTFNLAVRAVTTTPCGVLAANRVLSLTVQPSVLALSVAIQSDAPPGAQVSWMAAPNATNYVYYRTSMLSGNWQLLTNFVTPVAGPVSIWDPVGSNNTRYYRVQMSLP